MSRLKLNYLPEDEWHGELIAKLESQGFCGRGAAWFSISQLHEFCDQLNQYPIQKGQQPELRGGFYHDKSGKLEQCHVGILITPHDRLGRLVATIELGTPIYNNWPDELIQKVVAQFFVSYSDLESFKLSLRGVLKGETKEALLETEPA